MRLRSVGGVDDRLEQQRVTGNEADSRPDENCVVLFGVKPAPRFYGSGLAEIDEAVVHVVAGGPQPGDVVVIRLAQLLLGQSGELREIGRVVVDDLRVESDLDCGDLHVSARCCSTTVE